MRIWLLAFSMASFGSAALAAEPLAYIYAGKSACSGCPESLGLALMHAGYQVKGIKPGEITAKRLAAATVFAIPGGHHEDEVMNALKKGEADAIRGFVAAGGRFLGVCLGAYVASTKLETPRTQDGLGLIPVDVTLYPKSAPVVPGRKYPPAGKERMEQVTWRDGQKRWVYFQDGAQMAVIADFAFDVWATYANGAVAALQARQGNGKVGLIGPHLEADKSWGLPDPDGYDEDLFLEFMRELTLP